MSPPVRTSEERGGAWLRIVLDRPPGNLLSLEMVRALDACLSANVPPRRKWVTFEGAGDHFSYGARIDEHLPGMMEQVLPETHALLRRVLALAAATAALVRGRCLGGGFELALACDTIIAAGEASLGLPEVQLGVFPPAGSALLPPRVGASRSAAAIVTGVPRSAREWSDDGLVAVIAGSDGLQAAADAWFDAHLASRSAVAVVAAACASRMTLRAAAEPALAAAEKMYLEDVLPTHDAAEGVRAFVEKRAPQWKDR
ncbi:MAG: enoyl-CoA hydratase/isomerase family protein [Vicinamibacterales bacterium]